jgi:hypothetical protein
MPVAIKFAIQVSSNNNPSKVMSNSAKLSNVPEMPVDHLSLQSEAFQTERTGFGWCILNAINKSGRRIMPIPPTSIKKLPTSRKNDTKISINNCMFDSPA